MKIAVLAYLATYCNAPAVAAALAARGHEVTLCLRQRDVYGFSCAFEPTLLGAGVEAAQRDAVRRADRLVLCGLPALTMQLPPLTRETKPGAILLGDSHLLRDPAAANAALAASGLAVLAMPDKLPYLTVPARWFFPPTAIPSVETRRNPKGERGVVVGHSPGKASRRAWKGTDQIVAVLGRVSEGHDIRVEILRDATHEQCLVRKATYDIFIDQLCPATSVPGGPEYRGGLGKSGLEALAAGATVVTSGRAEDYAGRGDPPILFANAPEQLEALLEKLLKETEKVSPQRHRGPREEKEGKDIVVLEKTSLCSPRLCGEEWVRKNASGASVADLLEEVLP